MVKFGKITAIVITTIFCLNHSTFAQGNSAQKNEIASIQAFWKDMLNAYETGNDEAMWSAYTEDAGEISPDGNYTVGKATLRQSWEAFMKMADAPPKFTYSDPQIRLLTPDVAVLVWDSTADIKIGGQQYGGPTKGMAVLHKINGKWKIEFDSLTPVMPMPGGNE